MLLQGNRKPVRCLSLVLAAILFLGMVLIPADKTKAEETQVAVADMNKPDTAITYHTGPLGTYTCSFTMPENGTLELVHTEHGGQNMQVTITDSVGKTYTHSACNWEFAEDEMLEGVYVSEEHKFFTNLTGGQTYTLTFHSESNLQDALFRLRFAANTATLKSGKAIYGGVKKGCKSYYKINVPKNGYLKVQFQYVCCGGLQYQVRLLNAKKQPMRKFSDSITKKSKYTTYGVKKGIYYLEVKTKSASRVLYKIKATDKAEYYTYDGRQTSYLDKDVEYGTTYAYKVGGFVIDDSDWGYYYYAPAIVEPVKAFKQIYYLEPVKWKQAVSTGKPGQALLQWTKNRRASGYLIEVKKGNKTVKTITIKKNRITETTLSGLAKGKYSICIRAYRKSGSKKYMSSYSKKTVSVK